MKIKTILTDNGSQFTDRSAGATKSSTGKHEFDLVCKEFGIDHRVIPPRHPQINGMVERFNGHISKIVKQTRFASAAELEDTLMHYLSTYNHLSHRASIRIQDVQIIWPPCIAPASGRTLVRH